MNVNWSSTIRIEDIVGLLASNDLLFSYSIFGVYLGVETVFFKWFGDWWWLSYWFFWHSWLYIYWLYKIYCYIFNPVKQEFQKMKCYDLPKQWNSKIYLHDKYFMNWISEWIAIMMQYKYNYGSIHKYFINCRYNINQYALYIHLLQLIHRHQSIVIITTGSTNLTLTINHNLVDD